VRRLVGEGEEGEGAGRLPLEDELKLPRTAATATLHSQVNPLHATDTNGTGHRAPKKGAWHARGQGTAGRAKLRVEWED
jgi:hypothetical protein